MTGGIARRRGRGGFTLVEVLVATVATSLAVAIAYAALQAGLDVQARLARHRAGEASALAVRALLGDALRHAAPDADSDGFVLAPAAPGQAARLAFRTRGVVPPLGSSAAWQVVLASDGEGVVLDATPSEAPGARLRVRVPGARTVLVRVLGLPGQAWRDAWHAPGDVPAAVEVRFLDARGADALPPLVARTGVWGAA